MSGIDSNILRSERVGIIETNRAHFSIAKMSAPESISHSSFGGFKGLKYLDKRMDRPYMFSPKTTNPLLGPNLCLRFTNHSFAIISIREGSPPG
jgi:hypothetical protein